MTDEERRDTLTRYVYRYLSGRPIDGRPGYPYLRAGVGRLAGWQRQTWRLGMPAAGSLVLVAPEHALLTAGGTLAVAAWRGRHLMSRHRFHAEYIAPTLLAIRTPLGLEAGVDLYVDPSLGNLTPRLAKPLSPVEQRVRLLYGEHVEPVLRWLPDHVQRAAWAVHRWVQPATSKLDAFRRPAEELGPRIEVTVRTPYLTPEQRQMVQAIITSKIPVADLVGTWQQVGPKVSARWTVRKQPPSMVGHAEVAEHVDLLKEWEFYIGQTAGNQPLVISLRDDSPHIAVSAGTGAGKSVLAQLIAVQVLRRGGRVVILDRKGSHRWAIGQPGVDYCSKPSQMHDALLREAAEADERNTLALYEDDDWDPGPRTLIICEELNATIGQLANYWAEVREKGEPKKSPAIAALADLLFMGRAAKKNVIAIAQMLTARAIGGPEARENFGIRCLARYTVNAWKMLVPEAGMPRSSRTQGRWQVVIGGRATEVQVAYLTTAQARALANPPAGPDSALSRDVTGDCDMMTLQDAVDVGLLPWSNVAARQRMSRRIGAVPVARGTRGKAHLYARADLVRWVESTKASEPVS